MKNINKIFLACALALTFSSCSRFEDPIFDDSSAQRMNEAFAEYDKTLQSAPYGWSLDYYYGDSKNPLGGYKMLAKFKEGKVELASELTTNKVNAGTSQTSTYSFVSDNGPVLSFDSYNPILHYYSEASPSSPDGLGGDYEFIMESVTPEKIVMRGKKFGNTIVMRPLNEEKDFVAYVNEIKELKNIFSKLMRFDVQTAAGTTGGAINLDQSKWYNTENPEKVTYYAVSDEGIDLQFPVTLDGKEYDSFIFNKDTKTFHARGNTAITIKSVRLEYADIPGSYKLSYISNRGSKNEIVTIKAKEEGKSYTLTSETFILPIQLDYENGNLIFKPQNLGRTPDGSSGNLWLTVGYETNLLGYISQTYQNTPEHIMGGLWMQGTREKPSLTVMSQYTKPGIFGASPMKFLGLHKIVGTTKTFYDNKDGVNFLYNIKLVKQ
ncbi:DUF4302 domain-containing protein [Sphingobacterium sp.]|uniref:DUF4302 domain-containing protein n=1 Tax=Sphingobacterium sp. TaxID=341027 RepID=UPI0028A00371|nr:DUF4302 domain-containing protein [Sphingobacterium sp.]